MISNNYILKIAKSSEELDKVFYLRHLAYGREGTIHETDDYKFTDQYDDYNNCYNFLLMDRCGNPVGSVRLCVYSEQFGYSAIPVTDTYADIIFDRLGHVGPFVEANRLVTCPEQRKIDKKIFAYLYQAVVYIGYHFFSGWMVAGIKNKDLKFYNRMIGLEPLSEPRIYPGLFFSTVLSVSLIKNTYEKLIKFDNSLYDYKNIKKKLIIE